MTPTLVAHFGGIGDFILTCETLRRLSCDHAITLCGNPERLKLAVAAGLASEAVSAEQANFHTLFATPSHRARDFFGRFERAICWIDDADGTLTSNLKSCGMRDVACLPPLPHAGWHGHACDFFTRQLFPRENPQPHLPLLPIAPGHYADVAEVYVHPGSGGKQKNWPLERFAALSHAMSAEGLRVQWLLGPAEEGLAPPQGISVAPPVRLAELAQRLRQARLFIGNDGGIGHLAAAVGCPTLSIFGPTDPAVWAPRGPRVRVLQGAPWPDSGEVLKAARALLAPPDQGACHSPPPRAL